MEKYSPTLEPEIEPEAHREHGFFEASEKLLKHIESFRMDLEVRERQHLDTIIDPDQLHEFARLLGDKEIFNLDRAMEKEDIFASFERLAALVEAIGQVPEAQIVNDSFENLSSLGQTVAVMEPSVEVVFQNLKSEKLSGDEEKRAAELKERLTNDIRSAASFFSRRIKAVNKSSGNQY